MKNELLKGLSPEQIEKVNPCLLGEQRSWAI